MNHTFTLGREFYPYQASILEWCRKFIGEGGWAGVEADMFALWEVSCTFGYTKLSFRNTNDAYLFGLTWNATED